MRERGKVGVKVGYCEGHDESPGRRDSCVAECLHCVVVYRHVIVRKVGLQPVSKSERERIRV